MGDRWLVSLVAVSALILVASIAQSDQTQAATYSNARCKAAFLIPSGWAVVPSDNRAACVIQVRPRNFDVLFKQAGTDVFTIQAEIVPGDLQAAAKNRPYFVHRDGGWVIDTGLSAQTEEMVAISGRGWRGFEGDSSTRCYSKERGYAGICDIFVAMITDGRISAVFRGGAQSQAQFGEILKSFRFLK
jgi:hypothetical protein